MNEFAWYSDIECEFVKIVNKQHSCFENHRYNVIQYNRLWFRENSLYRYSMFDAHHFVYRIHTAESEYVDTDCCRDRCPYYEPSIEDLNKQLCNNGSYQFDDTKEFVRTYGFQIYEYGNDCGCLDDSDYGDFVYDWTFRN